MEPTRREAHDPERVGDRVEGPEDHEDRGQTEPLEERERHVRRVHRSQEHEAGAQPHRDERRDQEQSEGPCLGARHPMRRVDEPRHRPQQEQVHGLVVTNATMPAPLAQAIHAPGWSPVLTRLPSRGNGAGAIPPRLGASRAGRPRTARQAGRRREEAAPRAPVPEAPSSSDDGAPVADGVGDDVPVRSRSFDPSPRGVPGEDDASGAGVVVLRLPEGSGARVGDAEGFGSRVGSGLGSVTGSHTSSIVSAGGFRWLEPLSPEPQTHPSMSPSPTRYEPAPVEAQVQPPRPSPCQ